MQLYRATSDTELNSRSMSSTGTSLHGAELATRIRLQGAASFVSKSPRKTEISVTECVCNSANHGMTEPMPYRDGYMAVVNLVPIEKDLWSDGLPVRSEPLAAGALVFHDLRLCPSANFKTPFHTINFFLPRTALHEIADRAHGTSIETLHFTPGRGYNDETGRGLAQTLLPLFKEPKQASQLFVDSVITAFAIHIAQTFGGMRIVSRPSTGGLAPWQERRAKDMLSADLHGQTPIADLAAECRLSVAHFSRSFRQSTGLAPHQWLLRRRVEIAKSMLAQKADTQARIPLADVGLACGFADQSHFTRVFTSMVGVSPGLWRRELLRPNFVPATQVLQPTGGKFSPPAQ